MKLSRFMIILLSFLFLTISFQQACANTISPVSGTTSDPVPWSGIYIENVIDGAPVAGQYWGMGNYPHPGTWNGPYTARFDLGSEYDLSGFNLWNNDGHYAGDGEGIVSFRLDFFDSGLSSLGAFSGIADDVLNKQNFSFGAVEDTRYVDLVILSNDDTAIRDYAIFYEINFETTVGAPVPEPATIVLLGLGLLGMAGVGRTDPKG